VFRSKAILVSVLVVLAMVLGLALTASLTSAAPGQPGVAVKNSPDVTGWTQGEGWGPWGPTDEVGAQNGLTQAFVKNQIKNEVKDGKVYDLDPGRYQGMYLWPGHPPFLNLTYRTPAGERAQGDMAFTDPSVNPSLEYWISEETMGSQHSGAHFDSLAHLTTQKYPGKPEGDDYWYNGWNAKTYLGDFGPMKADISTVPPLVTRGVLLDMYGYFETTGKQDLLKKGYEVTVADMEAALAWEGVDIEPGDACIIRTGLMRWWGDNAKMGEYDGAGPAMDGANWLIKQKGCVFLGSDASALEMQPAAPGLSFNPVHILALIEQGVHIGEMFYLEDLGKDKVYDFLFVVLPNKIEGGTGSMVRPIAIN